MNAKEDDIVDNEIKLFEDNKIRSVWDNEKEEWYFSVVDVVGALTDSPNPNNYWKVLKKRLKDEGNELVTICNQLKMKSPKDGKMYKTDAADMQGIFRIIQSIPSPKAEPFKMWLAERIQGLTSTAKMVQSKLNDEFAVRQTSYIICALSRTN